MEDVTSREHGVEVPYGRLSADVLRRVAEEFVTREGTDYGAAEKTLEEKVTDVRRQLDRGEAAIVYEAESETINIVRKEATMGDRSPKSKQRDQKQKSAAKASDVAATKSKQAAYSRAPLPTPKGKK